ncbi:unnamed protein product [Rotaria magnacalcarata]|uniref:THAP-type domain-containing protein n=3 Tax=Rotaria magnacalcarata TaxID=392030 RepID=A0A816XUH5_9BILA|nr:unnamed protein product [Rotaria magnacalcarata]
MVKKCVACCNRENRSSNISFHRFPTDRIQQQQWLTRLKRLDIKDVSNKRVCAIHFDVSSFIVQSKKKKRNSGASDNKKRLKKDALPMECISDLRLIDCGTQTDLDMISLSNLFEKLTLLESNIIDFSIDIERFQNDDYNINYFTGFRSYKIFRMVFELLQVQYDEHFIQYTSRDDPALCHSKSIDNHKLSAENQFFLFMIRLRRATDEQELAVYFNISQSTVSRMVISWTRFVYSVVSSINLWPTKDQIQQALPFEMRKNYPYVRVIVDCTEFEIEQPANPQAQQDTWSTYKNTNTPKGHKKQIFIFSYSSLFLTGLVGITPNGIVSYISPLYGGATSDKAIINMDGSQSLIELLEDGDNIMSDRGFSLDSKYTHLTLIHPPFLDRQKQLLSQQVLQTRIIERHRIHVERCMGRIKNFKLLNGIILLKSIYLLEYWFYICTFFTIFDEPLVKIL